MKLRVLKKKFKQNEGWEEIIIKEFGKIQKIFQHLCRITKEEIVMKVEILDKEEIKIPIEKIENLLFL